MPAGIGNCKTGAAAGNPADRNDDNFDSEIMMDTMAEFPEVHRAQLGARCLFNKLSRYIQLVKGRKETAGPEMDQLATTHGGGRIEDVPTSIY